MNRHLYSKGFTLIELMVVVFIFSAAVGVVAIAVGSGNRDREIKKEAVRFQVYFQQARDHAVISGEDYGLFFTDESFQWLRAERKKDEDTDEFFTEWSTGEVAFSTPVDYKDTGLSFKLEIEQEELILLEELPNLEEEDLDQSITIFEPLITMHPDGESSPAFNLFIELDGKKIWQIESDGFHPLEILPITEAI